MSNVNSDFDQWDADQQAWEDADLAAVDPELDSLLEPWGVDSAKYEIVEDA